ncbi:leucine-rich repeat and coiled-coil domain-containing protein 1 [Scleropages formosus]|nr:leucine-rich repeat and coiled-coil domain-containing protein 1 [Scleropages formosus]
MADGGELSLIDKNISSLFEIPLNPSVRSLNLHCNGLSKIEGLLTAWYIRHLDLSSNKISCIEGLESLTSLQTLNLSCNLISKVEGLHGLVSLKRLNLSYNQISDLTGFLYLHGNEYKLKHLYLQCNRVNSMSQLLQCMRGLQSLRSVTLNLEGSRNPVCDTPGYREIILQSLPQLSALDGMDRHGNRVYSSDENALDILGLEDFADFLLSDVSVNNEKVLTRFHQRADHAKINQPTNIVEGKASSPNSPKRLLDAGNLLRIKKLENQVSQLIQLAPSSPSSTSTPTLTSMEKAKRDTDLTTESERDSGKEDNRKGASLRSRIPTHHKGLLTSRKQSTRDLRSQRSNSNLGAAITKSRSLACSGKKVDPPKKSQHVQTAPPSNTEGKHAAGAKDGKISMHTEEETYRAIIEERDQERERRWKAEQALKKLTEQLQNLQTQASEEKNLQNLALHTTDRLKELLLKERANCVKLQQRVEELERSLHSAQDELVQARSQEQQQQSVLHRLQDTATQNETLWAQQQAEETKRIQELENQVAALRREIEILRALAQQRKDKLHQLHELLASREQSHRKELESWIHPKGPEFHEAVAQAAAVSEQHHSQQLADLQEKLTEARQRYTDLEDEFRMALTIEAARFAEVKEGFNLQAAELTDCKAALAMSRQKEQQSATLVQELTSMVKEQKTRIAELIKSKREAVTDLKARVRTLEATVEDDKHRRLQLELLKQEKFKLLSELATQESVIDGLRAERKIWGQELAQQGASLAQDRGRLEARIEVLSTEVQTLRKQNESDNKTLKIKAKIVEDNTETIRKLKEGLQERDEQTRHLREESVQAQRRFQAQLEEETVHLGELREQVEQLIARKEELKQQLEDKEAELGEVKKEHSVMKRKWKDKAELLTQLEFQVKRMKESFDSKEKLLADEREKAVQAHKAALEKLRCVDNAFQRQMEAVQASHQAELLQLASDKQKEIELANHRVVQVEEEMRQLLEETKHKKRTMEEKMRCLSSVLKEF